MAASRCSAASATKTTATACPDAAVLPYGRRHSSCRVAGFHKPFNSRSHPGMKKNILIIGAGGVGHVVAHKCAQHNRKLSAIHLASRNPAKRSLRP